MKRLLILGAGGFGREVLEWASGVPTHARDWEIGGFLDANPSATKGYPCAVAILGDPLQFNYRPDDVVVPAIGDPASRLKLCRTLQARGVQFRTIVHPSAIVGQGCRLGVGTVLCPGVVVTTNVEMGDFVCLNVGTCVGHDAVVGDGCTLSPHCDLGGACRLGEGVFMGTHAVVLPSATVGDFAVIGAGSVVLRKVQARATVVGVPAREVYRATVPQADSRTENPGS
jgi:sugar O-acyltransferase (sialic acid O-acetyltransferase NeuD family)